MVFVSIRWCSVLHGVNTRFPNMQGRLLHVLAELRSRNVTMRRHQSCAYFIAENEPAFDKSCRRLMFLSLLNVFFTILSGACCLAASESSKIISRLIMRLVPLILFHYSAQFHIYALIVDGVYHSHANIHSETTSVTLGR